MVLNSSYAVLRLVSARRAFVLLVRQAAEVITIDGGHYESFDFARWTDRSFVLAGAGDDHLDWVHTATLTLAVPRIIRLTDYHGFPRQGVALTRRNVYARDGNVCQYCGKRLAARQLTIDHVIPRSLGGTESWSNLVTACMPCNTRKGGRSPRSAGMLLTRRPVGATPESADPAAAAKPQVRLLACLPERAGRPAHGRRLGLPRGA
ncbi:hypothetical protein GBAR_LOCUS24990 [Geodia barretti]|uniref:HNH nuclease domain-containing protein n=1 Tax=Geodia barretti TaxID=519541 RepID=A0AA35TB98_GEOBA|nr:hypothetical protein GBAR_LOCUS24990 [Geodia barretti]